MAATHLIVIAKDKECTRAHRQMISIRQQIYTGLSTVHRQLAINVIPQKDG